MLSRIFAAAVLLAILTSTAPAHAATITEKIDFTAYFPVGVVSDLPKIPVNGSVTITRLMRHDF